VTSIRQGLPQYYLHVAYLFEEAKAAKYLVEFCHPRTPQRTYIFRLIPRTLHCTLDTIRISGQPNPYHVQETIPRLIKPKLELLALLVLSVLAGDRNGPGVPIHPNILLVIQNVSIPLVVQMANLTTKKKTMLNSLPVKYPMWFGRLLCTELYAAVIEQPDTKVIPGLHEPSNVVLDDNLSSESDVGETRPRKRSHINLEVPANSHGRPLGRRHSPTENGRSTGSG